MHGAVHNASNGLVLRLRLAQHSFPSRKLQPLSETHAWHTSTVLVQHLPHAAQTGSVMLQAGVLDRHSALQCAAPYRRYHTVRCLHCRRLHS